MVALLAIPLSLALLGISVVAASGAEGPGLGRAQPPPVGPLTNVRGIIVDTNIAGAVEALLAAAEGDGIVLAGTGLRDTAQQIQLRQAPLRRHRLRHPPRALVGVLATDRPPRHVHARWTDVAPGPAEERSHATSELTTPKLVVEAGPPGRPVATPSLPPRRLPARPQRC